MATPDFLPVSPVTDSNRAPFPYEGNALPNELTGRGACRHRVYRNRGPRFGRLGTVTRSRVMAQPRSEWMRLRRAVDVATDQFRGEPQCLAKAAARVGGRLRTGSSPARFHVI
jgi:hypothetical protein